MPTLSETFTFGSISGSTFAFFFFLCLASFIGFAVYVLLRNPAVRRFGGPPASRQTAITAGIGISLLIFLGIYFSALDGFYRVEVERTDFSTGSEVRLISILPGRTRALGLRDIATISSRPAYKTLWRLVIRTRSGQEFASARSDLARVQTAQKLLAPLVNPLR